MMENNYLNKILFYGGYLWLPVFFWKGWLNQTDRPDQLDSGHLEINEGGVINTWLILRPLSDLTEDEAKEVCRLWEITYTYPENVTLFIEKNINWLPFRVYQYLQSECFALPWRDLTVEQLIEYGWIVIKSHGTNRTNSETEN